MPIIKPEDYVEKMKSFIPVPKMPKKKTKTDEKTDTSDLGTPSS